MILRMPRRRTIVWLAPASLVVAPILLVIADMYLTPAEKVLKEFYTAQLPECSLTAPLEWAGSRMVPLVIKEVANKSMPRRRYAISFLGDMRRREALPLLETVLADITERQEFRGDALEAIYRIDRHRGLELAADPSDAPPYLERVRHYVLAELHHIRLDRDKSC